MFEEERMLLLNNLEASHKKYYEEEVFSGPSLYFHQESLALARKGECRDFANSVYATLASWGMHRPGSGGSKMKDFEVFYSSLERVWPQIKALQVKMPGEISDLDWITLKEIFSTISVMESKTSLVGNLKVMAHALPNLIPPVDRRYTLQFLYGKGDITNNLEKEWGIFADVTRGFFHPFLMIRNFIIQSDEWRANQGAFRWDTSPLKIIDNLIIGYMKLSSQK